MFWGSGFNKYSMLFDGVNERLVIDNAIDDLAATTAGTWSAWVKLPSLPSTASIIIGFAQSNAAKRIILFVSPTSGLLRAVCTNTTGQWTLETNAAAFIGGIWAHVCIVQNGTSPVLYVNGTAPAQTFTTQVDKTQWFNNFTGLNKGRIANYNYNSGGEALHLSGNIDEVSIFNTNLSAAQISELYKNGRPANVLNHSASANLVSYWRMGDGTASWDGTNWTIPDETGTNNASSVNMEQADVEKDVP